MLHWTPWALPGLAVIVLGLALALFVYRARPDRVQNRRLALQLVLEAIVVGLLGGAVWFLSDARLVGLLSLMAYFLVWPKLWTYYGFLATLDTPLARPLQSRRGLNVLLVFTLLCGVTVFLRPEWYGGQPTYWPAVAAINMPPGNAFIRIFWMWSLMWLVGLSFSISALRHARTPLRHEQARAYLAAFGMRDISFTLLTAVFTFLPGTYRYYHWVFMIFPTIWLVYFPLVTYGILKHQLFDIDLRLKRGIERSAIAAVIAGAFFIGSEALEQVIRVNSVILGIGSAAVVAAAFHPLQRMAERMVDRMMPGVSTSEAYVLDRKYDVYREALEAAAQDGKMTERERAILQKLQQSLGITPTEANRIEHEVTKALTPMHVFA